MNITHAYDETLIDEVDNEFITAEGLPGPEVLKLQTLVNNGQGWLLEGSFGRALMGNLEAGILILGPDRTTDYWGSVIPSRDDVQQGTKGSYDYVVAARGQAYADALLEVL